MSQNVNDSKLSGLHGRLFPFIQVPTKKCTNSVARVSSSSIHWICVLGSVCNSLL